MSIFRTALRVAAAHPIYLTVYVVFLSLLGVLVTATWAPEPLRLPSGNRPSRPAWPSWIVTAPSSRARSFPGQRRTPRS